MNYPSLSNVKKRKENIFCLTQGMLEEREQFRFGDVQPTCAAKYPRKLMLKIYSVQVQTSIPIPNSNPAPKGRGMKGPLGQRGSENILRTASLIYFKKL